MRIGVFQIDAMMERTGGDEHIRGRHCLAGSSTSATQITRSVPDFCGDRQSSQGRIVGRQYLAIVIASRAVPEFQPDWFAPHGLSTCDQAFDASSHRRIAFPA